MKAETCIKREQFNKITSTADPYDKQCEQSYHKGIEPIIAEILLVILALALALIIWQFYSGFITRQGAETSQSMSCMFAQLNIQDVYINGSRGIVLLKNSGNPQLEITQISFLDKNGTTAANLTSFPVNMSSGGLRAFYFNTSSFPCQSFGSVLVYTSCSNVRPSFQGAPRC